MAFTRGAEAHRMLGSVSRERRSANLGPGPCGGLAETRTFGPQRQSLWSIQVKLGGFLRQSLKKVP